VTSGHLLALRDTLFPNLPGPVQLVLDRTGSAFPAYAPVVRSGAARELNLSL
jgi:hypothetical protein